MILAAPVPKSRPPLEGLRVLELSRVLAGPWAGQMLADLGADVIKVERPGVGDETRQWGPPWLTDEQSGRAESAYFLCTNRGKRSICIDLSAATGQKVASDLAQLSDVVIENFKTGSLAKYKLDYDTLKKHNPALIYCSITAFGQTGPFRNQLGYDLMMQALGGIMSITGKPDDEPQKAGVAITDIMAGMYATIAIQGALIERNSSGRGQYIDLALFDAQIATLANQGMNYLIGKKPPQRLGNTHPNIAPYQTVACSDGYIVIAVGNNQQFTALCGCLGCPQLASDERFLNNADRVANRPKLISLIEKKIRNIPVQECLRTLGRAAVPCAPVNDIAQAFAHPQVTTRGMHRTIPHPCHQRLPQVANPIRFSETPVSYERPPPLLGEHTTEILRDVLGYNECETRRVEELLAATGKSR